MDRSQFSSEKPTHGCQSNKEVLNLDLPYLKNDVTVMRDVLVMNHPTDLD